MLKKLFLARGKVELHDNDMCCSFFCLNVGCIVEITSVKIVSIVLFLERATATFVAGVVVVCGCFLQEIRSWIILLRR